MRQTAAILVWALLLAAPAAAQRVNGQDPQLPGALGPNGGLKVECLGGSCSGSGTTVTENGSIAAGGTAAAPASLAYVYNGAVWARLTFGQAVMASSLPVTIASNQTALPVSGTVTSNQGTANATPWNENLTQVGGTGVAALTGAATGSEASLPVRPILPNRQTTATAIAATGTFCTANVEGYASLILTLASVGGTSITTSGSWQYTVDGSTWGNVVVTSSATLQRQLSWAGMVVTSPAVVFFNPVLAGGAKQVRLNLTAFSAVAAATGTCIVSQQQNGDPFAIGSLSEYFEGTTVATGLAFVNAAGGVDAAGLARMERLSNASPLNTEYGQIARTIETPTTLAVTATAAVATAATATLTAGAAGVFHYITGIQIQKQYSIVGVAAGAGITCTTTNLPGSLAWTTEQLASPAGTVVTVVNMAFTQPLKSSVAATNTTVTCPLQTQTIWRINVTYYTGS